MAAPLPYGKFYYEKWLSSQTVTDMSLAAQGAYFRLLCSQWEDGFLPLDTDKWARRCGLNPRNSDGLAMAEPWLSILAEIIGCFVKLDHGYVNLRMQKDRETAVKYAEIQRENARKPRDSGSKPGTARAKLATAKRRPSDGLAMAEPPLLDASEKTVHLSIPKNKNIDKKGLERDVEKNPRVSIQAVEEAFAEFWKLYPRVRTCSKKETHDIFCRKVKQGIDPGLIVDGARNFKDHVDRLSENDKKYVPGSVPWLNKHRWEDELIVPPSGDGRKQTLTMDEMVAAEMRRWRAKQGVVQEALC